MMEEKSTCNINLDLEPKGELETDQSHVVLRHKCVTESEKVKFPFNRSADSLTLLSVTRYANRIKEFLGWEKEDSDAEDKFHSEKLSENEKRYSNDSLKKELDLSEDSKHINCKNDIITENLSVEEEFCSSDGRDIGLPLLFEHDINENEKLDDLKISNINSERSERSSCHLDIKIFSGYSLGKRNELLRSSYFTDESGNSISTTGHFSENYKSQKEIFKSEFSLDVEDTRTEKAPILFNLDVDEFVLSSKKNTDMDKIILQDNETYDTGLVLNDGDSIIQDEHEAMLFENDKKRIGNNEKEILEFASENSLKTDVGNSHENINIDNNSETSYLPEQSPKTETPEQNPFLSGTEKNDTKTAFNEQLIDEREQKKSIPEMRGEIIESQKRNLSGKPNDVQYKSDIADNNKNLINNNIKENYKINVVNLKIDTPLKAHVHCVNKINKAILCKETKNNEKQNLEDYDESTVCGLGIFKPRWLQSYATAKVYVILYSIIGILHGSYYSYLIGTLSTLEKRFAFKSQISGTIMITDEITPLLLGMIIGYYATKAHRPRIVALGMVLSAGCSFVTSLPYFIYGPVQNLIFSDIESGTGPEYCNPNMKTESCDPDRPQNLLAVICLLFGSFLKGFGNLAYYTIGLVYLDDNSDKQSTPIYLAIALALRLLGPLVGFLMSSGFLKYYENPLYDPGFGPDDPRWVGAWWMGFFLQGILLVIFTIPIALFPRRLPSQKKVERVDVAASEDGFKEILTGLISALKRLGKNPVFIVLIINTTMKVFGHFGHAIMLPKYMENQFRLSASEASLYSGATSIVCIIISTLLGGFLIWKFTPRIKVLLGGMIACEAILCVGYLILMIPRCQTSEMLHFGTNEEGLILNSVCNKNCDCSTSSFTPFCGPDGKTLYFSPCYAGCTEEVISLTSSKTNKQFVNCSCVDQQQLGASITEGFCPDENCRSQMIFYLVILFFMVTLSNLFTVAATMILLRSVHPSDKSVALGTFETFICLFGFIPFPVTFGALVDSACLVWEKSCGETGNCWFYDMEKYGYLLHGASALFCSLSVVCLITLYFLSPQVRNLYTEEDEVEEQTKYIINIKLDTVSGSVTKL